MNITDTSHQNAQPTQTPPSGRTFLTRAWVAVVLIPGFFLVAFAVTSGLYVLLGYEPENSDIPLWVDLVAGIPGSVVFLIPCVAAVFFGGRATRVGDRWGLIPATVGALAGLGFTIMSLVTIFSG
ncbi:MAG: hypothetical protein ACXVXZ_10785 [Mycobacteriaceae bacterium]